MLEDCHSRYKFIFVRFNDHTAVLWIGVVLSAGNLAEPSPEFELTWHMHAAAFALALLLSSTPARAEQWRGKLPMEGAIYAETIPFAETRDYVKKVLGNAVVYAQLIDGVPMSARKRLGATIGPRAVGAPPPEADLP